jgi:Na+-translocating ferredoxin:NAD+ oxidoreductase subunit G
MKPVSSASMILTLGLAGLVSGFAIVGVYTVTKPRIERNKAEALQAAVFEVVPGAAGMEALNDWEGETIYAAVDEGGELIGYAIPAEGAGFQDTIELLYGVDPQANRIVGMRVLESRETPGLGDKIIKDLKFVGQFEDLAADPPLEAVKGGADADHQIDAISGATISSKAVAKIINQGNATWQERLRER